ncbi:MAG TPA: response regulator transcription factor [Haliangium sp.]|nr:response regulator transcription factor [Haliangium sp.]
MDRGSQAILIVEDDESIAAGLALNLRLSGYTATVVQHGRAALEHLASHSPDLILLDINLPEMNGLEVMNELRQAGDTTPIIMLSAREDEYDKVAALRLGADDYVTKPFGLAELMARVDAVLRRAGGSTRATPPSVPVAGVPRGKNDAANGTAADAVAARADIHRFGDVTLDTGTHEVTRSGEPVKLTPLEFDLLCFLVKNPTRVFAREALLRQVWKQSSGTLRTVDNFVAQLRSKLELDPEHPRHFITVRGSGYRFDP